MGRPPTKPKRFKDGFYIEVRNKGANAGMKIHFETAQEMQEAATMYGTSKEVVILGEHKKDRWLSELPHSQENHKKAVKVVTELPKSLKPLSESTAKTEKARVEKPKATTTADKPKTEKPKAVKPAAKEKAAKPAAAKAQKPAAKKPAAKPAKIAKKKK
jgi:hypothetical protein